MPLSVTQRDPTVPKPNTPSKSKRRLGKAQWFQEMGVSENSVPLNPMVNDHLRGGTRKVEQQESNRRKNGSDARIFSRLAKLAGAGTKNRAARPAARGALEPGRVLDAKEKKKLGAQWGTSFHRGPG